uniref:Malate dehydrogenase, mitochondrial n=1 Tax=Timema douglasi TaxID=61478 RepID=A0A7R8VMX9_TIMDO|nr:unnamed protein product [Timema douglasi]
MLRCAIQCALRRNLPRIQYGHRFYSESEVGDILTNRFRVTVLGATGQVGQPLSLMLKQSPLIHELALYDVEGTLGVAADISQVDTGCKVCSFTGPEELDAALKGSKIVLITASGTRTECGVSEEENFLENAKIVQELSVAIHKSCPMVNLLLET